MPFLAWHAREIAFWDADAISTKAFTLILVSLLPLPYEYFETLSRIDFQ